MLYCVSYVILSPVAVETPVLTRLYYGNATLAGIPLCLLKRLHTVMNSAARLVFSSSRDDTPLLQQ